MDQISSRVELMIQNTAAVPTQEQHGSFFVDDVKQVGTINIT